MPPQQDRSLLRQAARGTLWLVALATAVCAVALVVAGVFVVVMT